MLVPYLPVQYHVLEVEEQQGIHILGPIPGLVVYGHIVVTGPQTVGTGQLVLEESAENPESEVILGKVEVHEYLDSTDV